MKKKSFLACVLFSSLCLQAQVMTPVATNSGGGWYNDPAQYVRYYEWSIGELVLVNTIAAADSSLFIYQGVLQPCTDRPGSSSFATEFGPFEYKLFPNPNTGRFEINFSVRINGFLDLELFDGIGRIIERRNSRYYGCCRIEHFDITRQPAGLYYLVATLRPDYFQPETSGALVRRSGFKLVKTNK